MYLGMVSVGHVYDIAADMSKSAEKAPKFPLAARTLSEVCAAVLELDMHLLSLLVFFNVILVFCSCCLILLWYCLTSCDVTWDAICIV